MKLNSPEFVIPDDYPYINDRFSRKDFGNSLFSLFQNIEDNPIVCLDSGWGEGKTTFIKMWLADLKLKSVHCIYFDAYKNDYSEDPFIAFSSEIINFAKTYFNDLEQLQKYTSDFKKTVISIGKKLLISAAKIGIKAGTMGVIDYADIEALKDLKEDISSASEDVISSVIENKMKSYLKEKDTLESFQAFLKNMGDEIKKKQNFPLLIIIDELDRCRPDYALLLIERIKHLFSVSNVSFLLLTNLRQLERFIETVYGRDTEANNYLLKFITIKTSFPKYNDELLDYRHNYLQFLKSLSIHHGINISDFNIISDFCLLMFQSLDLSLREIEKCFSIITLYFENCQKTGVKHYLQLVPILASLKVCWPIIYKKLRDGELYYDDVESEIIKYLKYENIDALRNLFKYFLLSDDEYDKLPEDSAIRQMNRHFGREKSHNRYSYLIEFTNQFELS